MRTLARLALAALVLIGACRRSTPKRWVLTDGAVMKSIPTPEHAENFVAAMVGAGDTVELLDEREYWSRVRTENGKEGWIQSPWLVPATAVPAVALEPGECHRDQFSGSPTSKVVAPGDLVFVERSGVDRWRVLGAGELCLWVKRSALSTEGEDLDTARLVHRARKATSWKEIEELLQRARTLHPGARAQSLVAAAAVALAPPKEPPRYVPPPLAEGEVPVSKAEGWECRESFGELSGVLLPVPDEPPGPHVADPAFEIHPVQTDGRGYASVPPRLPIDWDLVLKRECAFRGPFPADGITCSFRVAAPEGETAGRWYLATRRGVFAAKAALLQLRVRFSNVGQVEDMKGELLLRPGPEGGAGFAFWSPGPLTFRGCRAAFGDPRSSRPERGLRSKGWGPDGKLAILLGDEAASRRTQIERAWAPIHNGYQLEVVPGGEFLFVALEDVSYVAYNVEPKLCRPALLLRWSDLSEVARVECPRWP